MFTLQSREHQCQQVTAREAIYSVCKQQDVSVSSRPKALCLSPLAADNFLGQHWLKQLIERSFLIKWQRLSSLFKGRSESFKASWVLLSCVSLPLIPASRLCDKGSNPINFDRQLRKEESLRVCWQREYQWVYKACFRESEFSVVADHHMCQCCCKLANFVRVESHHNLMTEVTRREARG